ncbi:3153_t:CDS:2, partial [Acaulospora morrowiae]
MVIKGDNDHRSYSVASTPSLQNYDQQTEYLPPKPHSHPNYNQNKTNRPDYSERRTCNELRDKYIADNQTKNGYVEPKGCNPGLHVGVGDVIGLQYHLDRGDPSKSKYMYRCINESLVHIASAYCEGKLLSSMLKTLQQYEADFEAKSGDKKTALHRLYDNSKLKKDINEKNKLDKYVKYMVEAIEILSLFLAIKYEWPNDVIQVMLKKGADARIWDDGKKMNILCLAVQEKKQALVKWLLEHVQCLSEPHSIKMAKRHDPSFIGKFTFSLKNGTGRKLDAMSNYENYPPKLDRKQEQEEMQSEKPWFIEEIKKKYGGGNND